MIRRCLFLLALVALAPTAMAESFNAGWRQLTARDPQGGGAMSMMVWYPTAAVARELALGPFTVTVAAEAAPAPGRRGLVVISHGSGGSSLNHRDLAAALAQRGYIAVAPQHPLDNFRDRSGIGSFAVWAGRPRQLAAAIDAVLADPALGPLVDPGRIGAYGHSAGGYAVLALIGAKPDMAVLSQHCRAPGEDAAFCNFGGSTGQRNAESTAAPMPPLHDPRVRAAVAATPVGQLFTPASFAGITARLRLYGAEHDTLLLDRYHAGFIRDAMPGRAEYLRIANAGHYAFVAPFPPALAASVGEVAQDPPGFDRAATLVELNRAIVAFFDASN